MIETTYIAPALDRSVGLRRQVTFQAMRVFSGWGYREIQIPLIDYFDSIRGALGQEQIDQTFRFVVRRAKRVVEADVKVRQAIVHFRLGEVMVREVGHVSGHGVHEVGPRG